jgi:hypothetical protein
MNTHTKRGPVDTLRWPIAVVIGLLAVLFTSACSTGTGDSLPSSDGLGAPQSESMPVVEGAREATAPYIIRTAYVSMRVSSVLDARESVRDRVAEVGGMISSEDVSDADGLTYATLVTRVPADALDAFLGGLTDLGSVETLNISASDVTVQVTDLDARIASLDSSIARLRELQGEAANVADLVAVESELATRTAERDGLAAQRDYLGDQVAMSTATIRLAPEQEQAISLPNVWGSVLAGIQGFFNVLGWIISAAIIIVPTIAVITVIILAIRAVTRALRRS